MTEIPTESGQKLYLGTVIDLYSRRLLGAAMGLHPDADLACAAIKMAVAARGGRQVVKVGPERGDSLAAVPFLRAASRTRRASLNAPGSPQDPSWCRDAPRRR